MDDIRKDLQRIMDTGVLSFEEKEFNSLSKIEHNKGKEMSVDLGRMDLVDIDGDPVAQPESVLDTEVVELKIEEGIRSSYVQES